MILVMLMDKLYENVMYIVIPCLLNFSDGAQDCLDTDIM